MIFKNILYSGFAFSEAERELKFKYLFFNSLLFFNMATVGIVSIIRYIMGQYSQSFFDLGYVFLSLLVILISRRSKLYFRSMVVFVIFYSFILVFLLVYREENAFVSIGWLFVLLLTSSFLLDTKEKSFVFTIFILFVIFINIVKDKQTHAEILLSVVPFFVTILFLYFFDRKNTNMQIQLESANRQLKTKSLALDKELEEKKREMDENLEKTLESLVDMIEKRDTYTGGHSKRVANYSLMIAQDMGVSKKDCNLLYRAAILHDIGKISTPDSVLLKPSKLTSVEYEIIKEHVSSSYDMLIKIPMYAKLANIIIFHHERHDGKGYPKGLSGDEIPLLSQIMVVADSFDAMTTNRIYKGRKTILEAMEELKQHSGKQFNPKVVKSALRALEKVVLKEEIFQLPLDNREKERFSYFYKDQITGANNRIYLEFMLSQSTLMKEFSFMYVLYLHNFNNYNKKYGWHKGDELLEKFSNYLINMYDKASVFRVFGDDFILFSKDYLQTDINTLKNLDIFKSSNLTISKKDFNLRMEHIDKIEDIETLLLRQR